MGAVIELNKLKDQIDTNTFDNHNMTVRGNAYSGLILEGDIVFYRLSIMQLKWAV